MIISLHSLYPHSYLLKRYFITRVRSTTPLDTISPSHSRSPTPNIPSKNSRITSSSSHMHSALTPAEAKTPDRARNRTPTPSPRTAKKRSAETQASKPADRAHLPPSIPKVSFRATRSRVCIALSVSSTTCVCARCRWAYPRSNERTNEAERLL